MFLLFVCYLSSQTKSKAVEGKAEAIKYLQGDYDTVWLQTSDGEAILYPRNLAGGLVEIIEIKS